MLVEKELSQSQNEIFEVMRALEELAVSYDNKDIEINLLISEKESLKSELETLQVLVK